MGALELVAAGGGAAKIFRVEPSPLQDERPAPAVSPAGR